MWDALRLTLGRRSLVNVVGGILALSASSQVSLPWYPVPLTLQTFMIFLIGFTYTPQTGIFDRGLLAVDGRCRGTGVCGLFGRFALLVWPNGRLSYGYVDGGLCHGVAPRVG